MLEIACIQDSNCVGAQAQWSSAAYCFCLQHFGRISWRQWTPKMCGIYCWGYLLCLRENLLLHCWDPMLWKASWCAYTLNPVCWRTLPVFIKYVCHSMQWWSTWWCPLILCTKITFYLKLCSSLNKACSTQTSPGGEHFQFCIKKNK